MICTSVPLKDVLARLEEYMGDEEGPTTASAELLLPLMLHQERSGANEPHCPRVSLRPPM